MPKKVMYERFEDDKGLEFDFYLCLKLGHGSVARMLQSLSSYEYRMWQMYYQREAQRIELERIKRGG